MRPLCKCLAYIKLPEVQQSCDYLGENELASGWRLSPVRCVLCPGLTCHPNHQAEFCLSLPLAHVHGMQRSCGDNSREVVVTTAEKWGNTMCLSLHAHSLTHKCLYPPDISPLLPWSRELKQPTTLSSLWTLHSGIREVNLFQWVLWINMCALGIRQKCLEVKNPSTSYKAGVSMNRTGRTSLASPGRSPFILGLRAQRILPMQWSSFLTKIICEMSNLI